MVRMRFLALAFGAALALAFPAAAGEPPLHYVVPSGDSLLVFDARTEAGLAVDDPTLEDLDTFKLLKLRFLRLDLNWNDLVRPDPDADDPWAAWDARIARLAGAGFVPVVRVTGTGAPAAGAAARLEFVDFLRLLVNRWPTVRYWEIWPWADADPFFGGPDVSPDERLNARMELFQLAYAGVKQANPEAVVVLGALADVETGLTPLYAAGAGNAFDIVAVEAFGAPLAETFMECGRAARQIMDLGGDAAKPLWCTGVGVDGAELWRAYGPSPEGDDVGAWFDTFQASELSHCVAQALETGLYQKFFLYAWDRNDGAGAAPADLPPVADGRPFADYGFVMKRDSGFRPFFDWFVRSDVNDEERLGRPSMVDLELAANGKWVRLQVGTAYPVRAVMP